MKNHPESLPATSSSDETDSAWSSKVESWLSMTQKKPMKRELSFDFYTEYWKRQKNARSVMRWSCEDVIALLKGILEYQEIKEVYPTADSNGFHDFIKESLHLEFDRRQVVGKIRGLKKFYTGANLPFKGCKRMIIRPSNQLAYELAKKIWGKDVDDDIIYVGMDGKVHYINFSKAKAAHHLPTSARKNDYWQDKEGNCGQLLGKSSMSNGFNRNVFKIAGLEMGKEEVKVELEEKWKPDDNSSPQIWGKFGTD